MKLCVDCKHYVKSSIRFVPSGHGCMHPTFVRPTTGAPGDAALLRITCGPCGLSAGGFSQKEPEPPKANWLVRLLWPK